MGGCLAKGSRLRQAEDGAKRAAEAAMAAVLDRLGQLDRLTDDARQGFLEAPVTNAAGAAVGVVRTAAD